MNPKELAGLQQLAVSKGKSLTVNPNTGLPEAFELKDLLPSLIGAGISYFTDGLVSPATLGLLGGGATALATGDLNKGLTTGLGLYGGAGIAEGLMGAGVNSIGSQATKSAMEEAGKAGSSAAADSVRSQAISGASNFDKLSAGASSAVNDPMAFLKTAGGGSALKGGLPYLAALSPLMAGSQSVSAPTQRQAYIRPSVYDRSQGRWIDQTPVPIESKKDGGVIRMGSGGISDSTAIYDYLTGKTNVNPITNANTLAKIPFSTAGMKEGQLYFDPSTGTYKTYHDPNLATTSPASGVLGPNNPAANNPENQWNNRGGKSTDLLSSVNNTYKSTPASTYDDMYKKTPASTYDDMYKSTPASTYDDMYKKTPEPILEPKQGAFLPMPTPASTYDDMYKPTPTAGSYIPGNEPVVAPTPESASVYADMYKGTPSAEPAPSTPVASTTPGFLVDKFNNPVTSPVSGIFNTPNTPVGEANTAGLVYGGPNRGWVTPSGGGSESGASTGTVSNSTLAEHISQQDRASDRDARGGYLNNGRFDQRMARGGIAALAAGGDTTDPYSMSLQQQSAISSIDPAKMAMLRKLVAAGKNRQELPLDENDPNYQSIITALYGPSEVVTPDWARNGVGRISTEQKEAMADPRAWQNLDPQQKAAYFVDHPGMAAFDKAVGKFWSMSLPGMLQNALDPSQQQKQLDIHARADEARELKNALEAGAKMPGTEIQRNPYETIQPAPLEGITQLLPQQNDFVPQATSQTDNAPQTDARALVPNYADPEVRQQLVPDYGDSTGISNVGITSEGSAPGTAEKSTEQALAQQASAQQSVVEAARQAASETEHEGGEGDHARGGYIHRASGGIASLAAGGKGSSLRGTVGMMHGVEHLMSFSNGGYNLGSYSDGGRLLKGPGDGVSDSIPATIGHNQPARLADGEFVIPARIVSEIGNGSTDAGARKLYQMMARIQSARAKTIGKNKIATNTKADKYLPA